MYKNRLTDRTKHWQADKEAEQDIKKTDKGADRQENKEQQTNKNKQSKKKKKKRKVKVIKRGGGKQAERQSDKQTDDGQ